MATPPIDYISGYRGIPAKTGINWMEYSYGVNKHGLKDGSDASEKKSSRCLKCNRMGCPGESFVSEQSRTMS